MQVINNDKFNEYLALDKVFVVDFFATWCRPCTMMAPIFEKLESDYKNVNFAKVDVDECMELAQSYGILSIPCIIVFKGGSEVDRLIGFTQEDDIKAVIDKHLN